MKRSFLRYCFLLALLLSINACKTSNDEEEIVSTSLPPPTLHVELTQAETPEPAPTRTSQPMDQVKDQEISQLSGEDDLVVSLTNFESEVMGLAGVIPEGWGEIAPGVYARSESIDDVTRIIQQSAPGLGIDELSAILLQQLGVDELPLSYESMETGSFFWRLYRMEVDSSEIGIVMVDLALAETEAGAHIILLQTTPAEYDHLHDLVFIPAVDGLGILGGEEAGDYVEPEGRYSVPVPTNWSAEESDGYVTLVDPDGELTVHLLVVEDDDPGRAIATAWNLVDPQFDKEIVDVTDVPPSAVGGIDEYIVVSYEWDQGEQPIIQAEGRLLDGQVYVLLYIMELEAVQQRASQIQIISSGFSIQELETTDLSSTDPLPLSDDIVTELESFIVENMERMDVPGAAVAIVQDGHLVYSNGFGVKSYDSGEPITSETLMMIGSTTKSMTTMLMANLVDEGVIDWDTLAVEILPSFAVADPEVTNQITMRNMVCACTGVPRRDLEWLFNASELTAEQVIESLADFEFFTDFGEAFQYSNQMVAAGGYLATLATGAEYGALQSAYEELLRERILDPIGMESSTFSFDEIASTGDYASPHGKVLTGETVEIPMSYETALAPLAPAGALWSNVNDMAKYLITELSEGVSPSGEVVVSAENLAVTWEPQVDISADASYGLGWIIEELDGINVISHAGNTFGFSSELAFVPGHDLGVSILTNQQASGFNPVVRMWLFEKLFQQEPKTEELIQFLLEQSEDGMSSIRSSLLDTIRPGSIEAHLGSYENEALGTATLEIEDERLILDVGEFRNEIRAMIDDGDIIYSTFSPPFAGLLVRFELNEQGEPVVILGLGVVEYTFQKSE